MVVSRYAQNRGAVYSLKFHLVWCPKYRRPVLVGPVEKRLRELLEQKAVELQATVAALEVRPDHVHLFIETDPRWSVAQLARQFKAFSSHALREEFSHLRSRLPTLWSRSYFAGSCGSVTEAAIRKYIAAQKKS
jgi:putative transposase